MPDPNLYDPQWETPPDAPRKGVRLGHAAGARELGMSMYELPPGAAISTMHYPEIADYPTTGSRLTLTAPGDGKAHSADGEVPWLENVVETMRLDALDEAQRGTSTS